MEYNKSVVGPLQTNSYRIKTETGYIIVDLGDPNYLKRIEKIGDKIVAILLTHCHIDHILGISRVIKKWNIPIYISEDEYHFYKMGGSMASFLGYKEEFFKPRKILKGEEGKVKIDDILIKYYLFPGHTPGSLVYEIADHLFSGDLIFKNSIGRSDLFGGDQGNITSSLRRFMRIFDDKKVICPGHLEETTVGREEENNNIIKELL